MSKPIKLSGVFLLLTALMSMMVVAPGVSVAAVEWSIPMTAVTTNVGSNTFLEIGIDPGASDNYNSGITNTDIGADAIVSAEASPELSIDPPAAQAGDSVTITGTGFMPDSPVVAIIFGGVNLSSCDSIVTDDQGSFSHIFTVPALMDGWYALTATVGGVTVSTSFFIIQPPDGPSIVAITEHPYTVISGGPLDAMLKIIGFGFASGDIIPIGGITFAGAPWNLDPVTVGATGSWNTSIGLPPGTTAGDHVIGVTTNGGASAEAVFTATDSDVLCIPSQGLKGTRVQLFARNMTPSDMIQPGGITLNGVSWNTSAIAIDTQGNMTPVMLIIPAPALVGTNPIVITDSQGVSAESAFVVTEPEISLSHTEGDAGSTVTVIGTGWTPGVMGTVSITFGGSTIALIVPDQNGEFSTEVTVPYNVTVGNSYDISAADSWGFNTALPEMFTVTGVLEEPQLIANLPGAPHGETITISGYCLTPGGTVPIGGLTLGGISWNTESIPIDAEGSMAPTALVIPATALVGPNTLEVSDSGGLSVSTTLTITQPEISLTQSEGYRGETVIVNGTGWIPGLTGLVTIFCGYMAVAIPIPDQNGEFSAEFTVPVNIIPDSDVEIIAADATSNIAGSLTFHVLPLTLAVDPPEAHAGDSVTVTGIGFLPYCPVWSISLGGIVLGSCDPIITDDQGSFSHTFTVPGLIPGVYGLAVTVAGIAASTLFEILPGNTPTGSDVEVTNGDATITFDDVTGSGNTTVTENETGPAIPSGYEVSSDPPVYYDVTTTASYSGTIEVCFEYDESVDDSDLHLFHYHDGTWEDVITSVDTVNNIICGEVTSLSEFIVAAPAGTLCIDIPLKSVWNMVSVPVIPPDNSVASVFPGVEVVYTWNPLTKSYYIPTEIEPEKGYWVAVLSDTVITVCGIPVNCWTEDLTSVWNMIGSVSCSVDFTNPDDDPDGSVEPFAYQWDPVGKSYVLVNTIDPGKAYWIAATQECTLTLCCP